MKRKTFLIQARCKKEKIHRKENRSMAEKLKKLMKYWKRKMNKSKFATIITTIFKNKNLNKFEKWVLFYSVLAFELLRYFAVVGILSFIYFLRF